MMRQFAILATLLGALGAGSASASTYDFDVSGIVSGESVTDTSGGTPDFAAVLERSFSSVFSFDDTGGTLTGSGSLTLDLGGHPGQFLSAAETAGEASGTYVADLGPTLTRQANGTYLGSVTAMLGPTLSFAYDPASSQASLTADFVLNAVTRADDTGSLSLTLVATAASSNVSPVPLPASAPMFGAALFGLGLLARRKRLRRAAR